MPKSPTVPHPLPDPLIDAIAQRFQALGEPMRIKLPDHPRRGAVTVLSEVKA